MIKTFLVLILMFFCSVASAQQSSSSPSKMKLSTIDTSVYGSFNKLFVSNGALTDNGDGTATLTTGSSGSTITGLTPGKLPKAATSSTLTDSLIYSDGTNIGIGTTVPLSRLSLIGAGTTSATNSLMIRDSALTARVTITDNGNIGVGTSVPSASIHTVGGIIASGAGNTGIGTSVPRQALEVNGGLMVSNVGIGSSVPSSMLDVVGLGTTTATKNLVLRNNLGTSLITVLDDGNLGINITAPAQKLAVVGSGTFSTNIGIGTTSVSSAKLDIVGAGTTSATKNMVLRNSLGTALVTIDDAGNVGIGTITPTNALQIIPTASDTGFVVRESDNGSNAVRIYSNTTRGIIQVLEGGTTKVQLSATTGGSSFVLDNVGIGTSTPAGKLVVYGGNVGIGTTAPASTLEVIGSSLFGETTNGVTIGTTGTITMNGTAGIVIPHLMQSDNTDQSIGIATVAQIITFDTDVHHNGITRTSSSRFTTTKAGSYMIAFSGITTGAINETIDVWLRVNGTDVDNSNTKYTFKSTGGNAVVAVTFIEHFVVGDYFEFWTAGSNTANKWDYTAAGTSPTRPATPSIIITANYLGYD